MELNEADLWRDNSPEGGSAASDSDSESEASPSSSHHSTSSSDSSSSSGSAADLDTELAGSAVQMRHSLGYGSHSGLPPSESLSIMPSARRASDESDVDSPLHLATSLPIAIPKTPRTPSILRQSSRDLLPAPLESIESHGDDALVPPHTLTDNQTRHEAARTMDASMFKPTRSRSQHLVRRDSILEVTDMLDSLQVPAHGTRDSMGGMDSAAESVRMSAAGLASREPPGPALKIAA